MERLTWDQEQEAVKKAAEAFPDEFGLRAFPGDTFSISLPASFYSEAYGVQLYVYVKRDDKWLAFSKGTPEELRREVVSL